MHYDVVVAGGGTAGCVLAGRLSEDPARAVCLIEAGPDYGHYGDGRWPADILDGRRLALDSHCWERSDEEDRSQLRAQILGGCSSHNACVILRAADAGVDIADAAIASMSAMTSQPCLNGIVAALRNTERDTQLDQQALDDLSRVFLRGSMLEEICCQETKNVKTPQLIDAVANKNLADVS